MKLRAGLHALSQTRGPLFRMVVVTAAVLGMCTGACAQQSAAATTVSDAVQDGRLLLNIRPRFEHVEQEGRAEDANAQTVRSLLGWETQAYEGASVLIQAIDVSRLGTKRFNDDPAANASSAFPLVPDPDHTGLNQLYAQYTGLPRTRLRLGRQVVRLANNRMVANGEFRQIMQVFDGVTALLQPVGTLDIHAGQIWGIRNTLGNRASTRIQLLHGDYRYAADSSASAYGYFQDQPRTGSATGFADNSNRILGARVDGAQLLSATGKMTYTLEYARQDNHQEGNRLIDADYTRAGLGGWWPALHFRVDLERLSSNAGQYAFQTPLGNNHLYQGWSDQFASTPPQGLRELYVFLGGMAGHWHWHTEFHRYRTDIGKQDLGREFNIGLLYEFSRHWLLRVEHARYARADAISGPVQPRDVTKAWVTLIYDFGGFPANSRPFER